MKIDFTIAARYPRSSRSRRSATPEHSVPPDRPSRVACLLGLAHRCDQLIQSGAIRDYAELGRVSHVSRARITQIMNLLTLAPEIQEFLLTADSMNGPTRQVTERDLRQVVREVRWDRQVSIFQHIAES